MSMSNLTPTTVYLDKSLLSYIEQLSRLLRRKKADIMREAFEKGVRKIRPVHAGSAQALLDLAKSVEGLPSDKSAPKDLSINLDKYLWDEWEG